MLARDFAVKHSVSEEEAKAALSASNWVVAAASKKLEEDQAKEADRARKEGLVRLLAKEQSLTEAEATRYAKKASYDVVAARAAIAADQRAAQAKADAADRKKAEREAAVAADQAAKEEKEAKVATLVRQAGGELSDDAAKKYLKHEEWDESRALAAFRADQQQKQTKVAEAEAAAARAEEEKRAKTELVEKLAAEFGLSAGAAKSAAKSAGYDYGRAHASLSSDAAKRAEKDAAHANAEAWAAAGGDDVPSSVKEAEKLIKAAGNDFDAAKVAFAAEVAKRRAKEAEKESKKRAKEAEKDAKRREREERKARLWAEQQAEEERKRAEKAASSSTSGSGIRGKRGVGVNSSNSSSSSSSSSVFGQPLSSLQALPPFLSQCLAHLEAGMRLDTEGLYRVSASVAAVDALQADIDSGKGLPNLDGIDLHVVAGLVKHFLRSLPEPVCTFAAYDKFAAAVKGADMSGSTKMGSPRADLDETKVAAACAAAEALIDDLPPLNADLLRRLVAHLRLVVQHAASNRMDAGNVGVIFGPVLFTKVGADKRMSVGFETARVGALIIEVLTTTPGTTPYSNDWLHLQGRPPPAATAATGPPVTRPPPAVTASSGVYGVFTGIGQPGAGPVEVGGNYEVASDLLRSSGSTNAYQAASTVRRDLSSHYGMGPPAANNEYSALTVAPPPATGDSLEDALRSVAPSQPVVVVRGWVRRLTELDITSPAVLRDLDATTFDELVKEMPFPARAALRKLQKN